MFARNVFPLHHIKTFRTCNDRDEGIEPSAYGCPAIGASFYLYHYQIKKTLLRSRTSYTNRHRELASLRPIHTYCSRYGKQTISVSPLARTCTERGHNLIQIACQLNLSKLSAARLASSIVAFASTFVKRSISL